MARRLRGRPGRHGNRAPARCAATARRTSLSLCTIRWVTAAPLSTATCDVRRVELEPNWRGTPYEVTYVFLDAEPDHELLLAGYEEHADSPNVRVISPAVLGWSAPLNPLFFTAVREAGGPAAALAARHERRFARTEADDADRLVAFWLQSVVFLASVTLTAAIVQSRYSPGTIGSKYDRLWQAGAVSRDRPHLAATAALDLEAGVGELAAADGLDDVERLIQIRRLFERAVGTLADGEDAEAVTMTAAALSPAARRRFDFVGELDASTGGRIDALIVYGSAVASRTFADYDLVLVTEDPETVLRKLAGTSPVWRGKELNLGVYSPTELWRMQLLSGDNLSEYGLCLHGEVELPRQDVATLLERNLSFGMVRLRQQLGMLDPVLRDPYPDPADDRRSLYEYFVKVPANVVRGTLAAAGDRLTKEETYRWMQRHCEFDTRRTQEEVTTATPARALAKSAIASTRVLNELNERLAVARRATPTEKELVTS